VFETISPAGVIMVCLFVTYQYLKLKINRPMTRKRARQDLALPAKQDLRKKAKVGALDSLPSPLH
jgi:hypothetical protein